MVGLKDFCIDLKALNEGRSVFHYAIDEHFFRAVEAPDIAGGKLDAEVIVQKTSNYFELTFHVVGTVTIACSKCLDDMQQPIDTTEKLLVRFGAEYEETDELVVVPEAEGRIDISWFVYEFIQLDIPIQHVHAPGACNAAMLEKLAQHSADSREDTREKDPRWSKLNELKNK